MPLKGHGWESVIDALNDVVITNGLKLGPPGFSRFINTMPPLVRALAGYLASLTDTQRWFAAPGTFTNGGAVIATTGTEIVDAELLLEEVLLAGDVECNK